MIPRELREELSKDPFYKRCCLTGRNDKKIDFHHALEWKGRQVQERFCILPIIIDIHQYHQGITKEVKEKLDWIWLNRATDEELLYYSKAENYLAKRNRLNKKYGKFSEKRKLL